MAEDLDRSRNDNVGKAPWLKIFTGFKLALDPKKLLLAALGIFVAYLGWWAISVTFYNLRSVPKADAKDGYSNLGSDAEKEAFLNSAISWSLLHTLAGSPVDEEIIKGWQKEKPNDKIEELLTAMSRKYGLLRACPWNEDRGPNQFIIVSKIIQKGKDTLTSGDVASYLQFMIEPVYKFLLPVTFFFDARAGGLISWNRIYLMAIIFWTIATWGIFGGAITRMAAVQITRGEKVGLRESLEFVLARWQAYVFAPVLPLLALLIIGIMLWFFGLFFGITFFLGDIGGSLLWPFTMVMGLVMAVIMVGLLGWPLMNATISTEGSDSFDALSRSYSYVYQVPWYCLAYSLLSVAYGAVLFFFVGFMGSLMVYLGNWGVTQAYYIDSRDPAFLCVYAPTSFGWRDVLLKDSPNATLNKNGNYEIDPEKLKKLEWYQHTSLGTYVVTFWLSIFFLLILGFGYSFFWSAATIIYLLLRQKVDDTDLDEVYLEEDDDKPFMPESPAGAPAATAPASNSPPAVKFTMVDLSSSIRPAEAPAGPAPAETPPAPHAEPGAPPPGM